MQDINNWCGEEFHPRVVREKSCRNGIRTLTLIRNKMLRARYRKDRLVLFAKEVRAAMHVRITVGMG